MAEEATPGKDPSPAPAPPGKTEDPPKPDGDQDNYWKRQAEKSAKELEKLKKSQMTDAERIQTERDEARREADQTKSELKQERIKGRFETAAAKAGCLDSSDAFKLADLATMGDNGEGVDKAVEALKKSKPWLFGQQTRSVGGAGGVTGAPPPSKNQAINDEIRRFARGGGG